MPLIATKGAASAQGFGEFAQSGPVNYIEDVFSTYLIPGSNSTVVVNNGIDLSGKGGLVWQKNRAGVGNHYLEDTARGAANALYSNLTNAQAVGGGLLVSGGFSSNGFTTYVDNGSSGNQVSWTFRKQPKFFDVVTFTTSSSTNTNQRISHNLGSTPGTIIVKNTGGTSAWPVWHRSLSSATDSYLTLNTTTAASTYTNCWGTSGPTSTDFGINTNFFGTSANYVAYIFAHNAGGFGLTGSDNVITCGSFTTDSGGNATVNLGYEPQWLLLKGTNTTRDWWIVDTMRAMSQTNVVALIAETNAAEYSFGGGYLIPTATGFKPTSWDSSGVDWAYIAIRRGPMKTPTSGTSVYKGIKYTGNGNTKGNLISLDFPADLLLRTIPSITNSTNMRMYDRLRGQTACIKTHSTAAEITNEGGYFLDSNVGVFPGDPNNAGNTGTTNDGSTEYMLWSFRRAPGFFDVVCYTGTGSATTQTHNLGVAPELIITKRRSSANSWLTYSATLGIDKYLTVETTDGSSTATGIWGANAPTSTVFSLPASYANNSNGATYVAYLFASCPGVSKVGSYTGTGTTLQVNCGFTNGSRFVLIKRTDSTGDWYVWDSARGIVAGNDPYLLLNSSAAEVTNTDYVDTYSAGFEISSTAPAAINANGGTFIFLAVA